MPNCSAVKSLKVAYQQCANAVKSKLESEVPKKPGLVNIPAVVVEHVRQASQAQPQAHQGLSKPAEVSNSQPKPQAISSDSEQIKQLKTDLENLKPKTQKLRLKDGKTLKFENRKRPNVSMFWKFHSEAYRKTGAHLTELLFGTVDQVLLGHAELLPDLIFVLRNLEQKTEFGKKVRQAATQHLRQQARDFPYKAPLCALLQEVFFSSSRPDSLDSADVAASVVMGAVKQQQNLFFASNQAEEASLFFSEGSKQQNALCEYLRNEQTFVDTLENFSQRLLENGRLKKSFVKALKNHSSGVSERQIQQIQHFILGAQALAQHCRCFLADLQATIGLKRIPLDHKNDVARINSILVKFPFRRGLVIEDLNKALGAFQIKKGIDVEDLNRVFEKVQVQEDTHVAGRGHLSEKYQIKANVDIAELNSVFEKVQVNEKIDAAKLNSVFRSANYWQRLWYFAALSGSYGRFNKGPLYESIKSIDRDFFNQASTVVQRGPRDLLTLGAAFGQAKEAEGLMAKIQANTQGIEKSIQLAEQLAKLF